MCLTLLLSAHSHSCLASLVDVTVSPTGSREKEKERAGRWAFLLWMLLTSSSLYAHNTLQPPNTHTHSKSQHPHVDPWQSQSDATAPPLSNPLTPSLTHSFFSRPIPASWPRSFLWVVMETANKAITFTNFLRDRCWHNDCFLAG